MAKHKRTNSADNIAPSISVIIALYNAEPYIGECLTSLVNQTMQDFEIIVVDDCSTDNSREVVKSFSETFGDKLKLKKTSRNSGCPGFPRNFAMGTARGKYIYFLDADDTLTETAFAELYEVAENFSADVVHVEKYTAFKEIDGQIVNRLGSFQTGQFVTEPTLETSDIGERVRGFTQKRFVWWACNKLLRRQFLVDNKIKFPDTNVFEDMVFAFMCIVDAKNYVRVPFVSYRYRIHDGSLSHRVRDPLDSTRTMMKIVGTLDAFMNGKKFFRDNPLYKYMMLDFFLQERLNVIARKFFVAGNNSPDAVYNFFRDKIFPVNAQDNVALTSYLFVAVQLLKLQTNQQAAQIDELNRQLAALNK